MSEAIRWMLGLVIVAELAGPGAAAELGKRCYNADPKLAQADPRGAAFRRLDALPPAAEIRTVLRAIDGCEEPVVVRYGIGGRTFTQASQR